MTPIDTHLLTAYGWNAHFETQYETLRRDTESDETPPVEPARVVFTSHGLYDVLTARGLRRVTCAGRLRYDADSSADTPTVGDWVGLRSDGADGGAIVHLFARSTALVRKQAGRRTDAQVLAANVDIVFVVSAMNSELNERRLERFLAMVLDAGARPVFVLNKADLLEDTTGFVEAVRGIAPTAPIVTTSATRGDGLDSVRVHVADGETIALVGSSGVGKSALTNRLLGRDVQREGAARVSDDRGRHTTAHRELFVIPGGGLLIDTPGIRELALFADEASSPGGFDDVDTYATDCRFTDCVHNGEPGCAVRAAVEAGALFPERLAAWHKLRAEQSVFLAKTNTTEALARKRHKRTLSKLVRQVTKMKKR
jgi:ribosome biogenesis GTPase / thiamine phosphate phosphatase